jgi:hypothetical protein
VLGLRQSRFGVQKAAVNRWLWLFSYVNQPSAGLKEPALGESRANATTLATVPSLEAFICCSFSAALFQSTVGRALAGVVEDSLSQIGVTGIMFRALRLNAKIGGAVRAPPSLCHKHWLPG